MKRFIYFPLIGAFVIFISCSGNSQQKDVRAIDTAELAETIETQKTAAFNEEPQHPGQVVYSKYCLMCHQADGSGVPGMHPPLWPNKWINSDKAKMIEITLKGLSGEIEVDGEVYNNLMPPHGHLTDLELANVISFVRSSFGNKLDSVSQEEVAAMRQQLN